MPSKVLIHPTYFPSISHYVAICQSDELWLESDDHFQKQTNRNRMYIYGPNGKQLLNIPIKHSVSAHQKYRDVKIEYAFDWQKQHFKSLEAAYRTSPYFEYFEDDIRPFFEKKIPFLFDLNIQLFETLNECLGLKKAYNFTEEYFKETAADITDLRYLANGKKDENRWEKYHQVFGTKFDYINNLSILDLLFNEGRHAIAYLNNQSF